MGSESKSGGGPGGEEGARGQGGAGEGARSLWALSSSCMEATAATRSDIRSSGAGAGTLAMAVDMRRSAARVERLRRLHDFVSPGAAGAGGAAKEGAVEMRSPGAGCPNG
jgi:hypothetical protein